MVAIECEDNMKPKAGKRSQHAFLLMVLSMILMGTTNCSTSVPVDEKARIKTADTELYADIQGNDPDAP